MRFLTYLLIISFINSQTLLAAEEDQEDFGDPMLELLDDKSATEARSYSLSCDECKFSYRQRRDGGINVSTSQSLQIPSGEAQVSEELEKSKDSKAVK